MEQTYSLLNLMRIHSFNQIIKDAFSWSVKMDITVYDASYVFLAMTLSIPLVTSDKKLINKIKENKLNILWMIFCSDNLNSSSPICQSGDCYIIYYLSFNGLWNFAN